MDEFVGPVVLSVTSRFENIEVVQMVCDTLCAACGFDGDATYQVGLAVREGVANAMKHGNRFEPSRLVEVRFDRRPEALHIEVEDEGGGFEPGKVLDPLAPENLLRTSGRGILYVRNFVDRYDYRFEPGKGTVLIMEKRLSEGALEPSMTEGARSEP